MYMYPAFVYSFPLSSDMTLVSGDSRGRTIFWNGKQGTQIKVSI